MTIRSRTRSTIRPGDDRGQQGPRLLLLRQSVQHQLGEAGQSAVAGRRTDRQHASQGLGQQPARDEAEDLPAGRVEPLRVVDEAQQGATPEQADATADRYMAEACGVVPR